MAPLIAPGIARFAVNGTYGGRNVVNIFDMFIDNSTLLILRDEAVFDQAGDILNAFDTNILPMVVNEYVAQTVSWVDLNSETGTTGFRNSTGENVWPTAGAGTATPGFPGNVAALITKVAPGGGRRTRNGRTYMCGPSEATTDDPSPSNLTTAIVAQYTAGWEAFSSDISNTVIADNYSSNLVVVHTHNEGTPTNPDIVYDGFNEVTAMVCQSRLATQRRRLRG